MVTGNESGWASAEVVVPLASGVVLLGLFIGWEGRAATPMLPLKLFRRRTFSASAVVSLLLYAALYGTVFFLSQYLQIGRGYTALESGLRLIPWTATLLVVAPLAGAMADRFGNRPVLVLGLALKAVGLGWLSLVATPETSYAALLLPLLVEESARRWRYRWSRARCWARCRPMTSVEPPASTASVKRSVVCSALRCSSRCSPLPAAIFVR